MSRIAVVLFNLGGPDSLQAVKPFLKNLFSDPAIIAAPAPVRWFLARFISTRRAPIARKIYEHMGGRSPILQQTEAQADALRTALAKSAPDHQWHVSIAMRYWHPMSEATAREGKAFGPGEIILLPLYPQFSTTSSGSSLKEWTRASLAVGMEKPTRAVCCYPCEPGYVKGLVKLIQPAILEAENQLAEGSRARVLFSAHGLPEKVIARGDPYQWQIEQTSAVVAEALKSALERPDLDWAVCYQSRVGPLKWIGPSLDGELESAGRAGTGVVVIPVAFVSEHSETLVELDIEYRDVARERGIPVYVRVPALSVQEDFLDGLAQIVETCIAADGEIGCQAGKRQCPSQLRACPLDETR